MYICERKRSTRALFKPKWASGEILVHVIHAKQNETELHWHLLDLCMSSRVRVGCTMFCTPPLDCKQGCLSSQHCFPFQTFHPAAFVCLNIQWKLLKHHCIRFVMFWTYIWKRSDRSSEPRFLCHRYKRWHTLRMVITTRGLNPEQPVPGVRLSLDIPSGSAPVVDSKRHMIALWSSLASVQRSPANAMFWSNRKFSSKVTDSVAVVTSSSVGVSSSASSGVSRNWWGIVISSVVSACVRWDHITKFALSCVNMLCLWSLVRRV